QGNPPPLMNARRCHPCSSRSRFSSLAWAAADTDSRLVSSPVNRRPDASPPTPDCLNSSLTTISLLAGSDSSAHARTNKGCGAYSHCLVSTGVHGTGYLSLQGRNLFPRV